jgi:Leucine-rich repeat (LRR) protein
MDFKQSYGDKKQLRSINLSNNSLAKLGMSLEKSLQYMNISYNKLKSLAGIESCVNLKFINVSGNQISTASNLILL